jgi:hypothetical protein
VFPGSLEYVNFLKILLDIYLAVLKIDDEVRFGLTFEMLNAKESTGIRDDLFKVCIFVRFLWS